MLFGDIIRLNARRFKDKIAFRDERTQLTFEQVNRRANCIANALIDIGVRKGDKIAVLLYTARNIMNSYLLYPKPDSCSCPPSGGTKRH